MCSINYIGHEDVRETLLEEVIDGKIPAVNPVITILVGSVSLSCILDTGSPFSIISEAAFQKCELVEAWPILPLQGTKVKGAIFGKSIEVKRQTQIGFTCQGVLLNVNLLIVPLLNAEVILGVDFMNNHQAILDLGGGEMILQVEGAPVKLRFDEHVFRKELDVSCLRLFAQPEVQTEPDITFNSASGSSFLSAEQRRSEDFSCILRDKIDCVESANDADRLELYSILHTHAEVFSDAPGAIKDFVYEFRVKEHKKFFVKPYSIPVAYKTKVEKEIQDMLKHGVIEHAVSSYNSPLLVVPKKDNSVRLVLDSRQINTVILPETDRPESLEELLQRFHNVKVLSSIDLRASYWQIMLHPACRQYTAFLCFGNCYQFKRLPFGLNVSSAAFIRGLNMILPDDLKKRVTLYVDDILIAEKSWADHNEVLNRLLCAFRHAGVTVNLQKSQFGRSSIKFLGHIISGDGIHPDPDKIKAVKEFANPTTKKQLRAFLGLTNFYKRFINMNVLSTPRLCALTGKKETWNWDQRAQKEFSNIKSALVNAPILAHPDLNKDFCIMTDSSVTGLGAVLFQETGGTEPSSWKTIAFASRILSRCERNYSVTELECLAIVFAFTKFRYFLFGRTTKVYTDHRALQFLMSAKLTHGRLARWALYLQEYKFTIEYIPGNRNVVADALSRAPSGFVHSVEGKQDKNISLLYLKNVPFENYVTSSLEDIAKEQDKDQALKEIKEKWYNRDNVALRQHYLVKDGILFRRRDPANSRWLLCIPDDLINKLIWYIHLSYAHFGARKCFNKLREACYFSNMLRRIRGVLSVCESCQKAKPPTVSYAAPIYPIIPTKLRDLAAVDLFGPIPRTSSGFTFVFVAIELTSKYVSFTPLRRATGKSVAAAFVKHFLREVGTVKRVISDNGPQFRSQHWLNMVHRHKIKQISISSYHPSSNPAERVMKELGKLCRLYCHKQHRTWDKHLKSFQDVLNELPNESTSLPPVLVLKNRDPPSKIKETVPWPKERRLRRMFIVNTALQNLNKAAERRKRSNNQRVRQIVFHEGQKVLVRSHRISNKPNALCKKFFRVFNGPFRIRRIPHPNAIEVETLRTRKSRGLHHISNVKPFLE